MINTAHYLCIDDRVYSLIQQEDSMIPQQVSTKHDTYTDLQCQMLTFTCNLKLAVILPLGRTS